MAESARARFAVYCSSRGDYFFAEIRRLLACGLKDCGARAVEADERQGFVPGADWHVVVGAQQFFYLGAGARLRMGPWPAGVVLYNAEQPRSDWFSLARRLMPRARAVWEMDRETSRAWTREGRHSSWVPLGFSARSGLFDPAAAAEYSRRPLDLFFAGSRVPRRERFFAREAALLSRHRSRIRLVDDQRYLRGGRGLAGLARRAKIALNIHRQDSPYFEWHRIAVHGLGQGALVVSEPTSPAPPLTPGRDFVAASLSEIPEAVDYYLSSERGRGEAARIAARGREAYRAACALAGYLAPAIESLGTPGRRGRAEARAEAAAGLLLSRLR